MKKDTEWKKYFEDNQRYADIINGIGCCGRQVVKDTDLEEIDSEAKGKVRDLLRRTAFGANFALIGIENQDTVDYEMPIRNLSYDVAGYQKQARKIKQEIRRQKGKNLEAGEFLYGFRKEDKLHPIITFFIYSGEEQWDGPTSLHDILDFSSLPKELKEMTPDYPLYIIDIRRFNNTEVFRTDVKYVFDFIRCSGNKEALWELVNTHEYYKQMDEDAFDVITKYTNSKELMVMRNCEEKEEKKDVCKAIKDLMETSKEVGISEGKIEGKIEDILEDLSCLGEVPQELLKKIKAESDMDTLRRWRKLASRATSLEEFVVNCDNTFSK